MTILQALGSGQDGGAETYFEALVAALARAGLPQALALRAHAGRAQRLESLSLPSVTLPFGGPLDLATKGRLRAFAAATRARAIIAWMNRAARHTPKGPWLRIGRLGGYYKLKNYAGFDLLVGNTPDIVRWIVAQGWPASRARCVPNFATTDAHPAQDRALLDTPANAPLLLGMGRLHESKAHDVSLRALTLLPDAYLWIAGAGDLEAELKALAASLDVANRVRFLGWRSDAGALYRAADVCVFPSRFEPLGNVVLQAWAYGLPIVAAASQGPRDLIRDGVDGRLVPIDDAEALANATARLLADRASREAMAAAGRGRVASEFSETAIVAQWRALLKEHGALACAA